MDLCGCTAVFVWTSDGELRGAHVVDDYMQPIASMVADIDTSRVTVIAVKIEAPDIVDSDLDSAKTALVEAGINVRPASDVYKYSYSGGYRFVAKAGRRNAGRVTKRE